MRERENEKIIFTFLVLAKAVTDCLFVLSQPSGGTSFILYYLYIFFFSIVENAYFDWFILFISDNIIQVVLK